MESCSPVDARDLARLAAAGAQPAGPPPLPPASGDVIEVDRTVNASGNVSLGDRIMSAGLPLAGQRITLRPEGPVVHVLVGGVLARTLACPVPPQSDARYPAVLQTCGSNAAACASVSSATVLGTHWA